MSPKPKPKPVPTSNQVKQREKKRDYDKLLNDIKLANEKQDLMLNASDTFKFTGCNADCST